MANSKRYVDDRFWRFSLDRYRRPDVADICLAMQDEAGVDVNLLLFCLWCGQEGVALAAQEIATLDGAGSGEWRETVVMPLRAARLALKEPPCTFDVVEARRLRTTLKRVEIESERMQQVVLANAAEAMGLLASAGRSALRASTTAKANASAYLGSLSEAGFAVWRLDELVRLTID